MGYGFFANGLLRMRPEVQTETYGAAAIRVSRADLPDVRVGDLVLATGPLGWRAAYVVNLIEGNLVELTIKRPQHGKGTP